MAFTFYTGVHMAQNAPWDSVSYPNEMSCGGIRMITWPGDNATAVTKRVTDMQIAGKYVIVCVTPGDNIFSSVTPTSFANTIAGLIAAGCQPDAWELGNEPGATGWNANSGAFWPVLVAAANKCIQLQPNVPRILSAPYSNDGIQNYFNAGNTYMVNHGLDIRDLCTDWAIHLYSPGPVTAQNNLANVRAQVNAFANPPTGGGSYVNMPVHVTEWGWTVYGPPGTNQTMVVTPAQQAANLTTQMAWFRDNRTTYKIRGAYWFIWQDTSGLKGNPTGYYGIKKNVHTESVNSPPAGVAPSPLGKSAYPPYSGGVSPNGYRAAKAALDAFQPVYDATAGAPPVVTTTTPAINITQTTATLKGTVNPQGKPTTFYFDYGSTTSYGTSTAGAPAGAGSSVVNVQANITSLTPGQTYHFRIRAVNGDGTTLGAIDRTFATAAPPLAPTVNTGSVTGVISTGATIWGSVNPNGLAISNYHFEYGLTTAYGTNVPVPAPTLPAGTATNFVFATLTGLTSGLTYHYRLVATNSAGTTNGADRFFTVTAPPSSTAPELSRVSVLSTLLSVEVTTADRRSYRWDIEDTDVQNRPLGMTFATQQGDGFAEASCTLPRPINLDWPDLHLLDRLRFIGADGSIAYEGRVASIPRRVDSDGEMIEVQAQGLMASARDRTFTDIIVDRSGDRWQEPSLALRKATLAADFPLDADYSTTVDSGSIHFKGTTNKRIPVNSQTIAEYIAPSGVQLASFQYTGTERNISNEGSPNLRTTDDDSIVMPSWGTVALTLDGTGTIQTATPASPVAIFGLRLACAVLHGDGTNPAAPAQRHFEKIAVYSDHGIELQDNGDDPDGVWASDVITNLINRFCPALNADGVAQTTTVIPHLVFDTPTTPFDAFTLVNGYHLWNLGAWEDGKVIFEPADLGTIDWQVRSDDMGVTLDLEGDAVDQFANGIVVSYTDVDSRAQVLWPDDWDQLRDDDPDNDANKWGDPLWTSLDISVPVDRKGALVLGHVALREFNRAKAPGNVNLTLGYLEDGQGNLQPGWKARAGQTIAITDLPREEPRLITGTAWGEDGSLQINISQPSTRVDAVLARLETSAQVRGL